MKTMLICISLLISSVVSASDFEAAVRGAYEYQKMVLMKFEVGLTSKFEVLQAENFVAYAEYCVKIDTNSQKMYKELESRFEVGMITKKDLEDFNQAMTFHRQKCVMELQISN